MSDYEFPVFDIGPVLEFYGGDPTQEDRGWHATKCPFHGDHSASASVNTTTHVFNCHACEYGGNAVQLIMKKENLSYGRAVERAKEIAGESNSSVRGAPGRGKGVSGKREGNRSGVRALKRAGSRSGSRAGARASRG